MTENNREPGTMKGLDTPNDDSSVAENTNGTEWDLTEMSASQLQGTEYRVLSTRNNTVTHYKVDIDEGTCECPSEEYNLSDNEACPHLAKALLVAPAELAPEDYAARDLTVLSERARNLLWDLRDAEEWIETVMESEAAGAAAEETRNGTAEAPSGEKVSTVSAEEAAGKLQEAYDNVMSGIEVEYSGGVVWVNKSPDAPDTLPGPGNIDTFESLLQNPEQLEYVHDDHRLADEKPGQYFSNMIEPQNVDEYIAEVLE